MLSVAEGILIPCDLVLTISGLFHTKAFHTGAESSRRLQVFYKSSSMSRMLDFASSICWERRL